MHIAVLNASSQVSDADVRTMTTAVAAQVQHHAAPAWGLRAPTVTFMPGPNPPVPPGVHGITIVDYVPDEPSGVLGLHTEDQGGKLWGVVACGPVLGAGQQTLTGDWSVASVLSHEVLEMLADPDCNLWASNGQDRAYSYEICDPVEAPTYEVTGVSVSNFVLPAWFDPLSGTGAKFDHLGLLRSPFSLLKGGYVVCMAAGAEHQIYGEDFPEWRKAMKASPYARTQRRVQQGTAFAEAGE